MDPLLFGWIVDDERLVAMLLWTEVTVEAIPGGLDIEAAPRSVAIVTPWN